MPYTKLIIKYQRDDYCCCAWLYATSVKIANKPQSIESNYENGNIIYIVMNNSNNEAVHFTDRYEASCGVRNSKVRSALLNYRNHLCFA
jgi:hypothetical protein